MPEEQIDLKSLLSENTVAPPAVEPQRAEPASSQPETAATDSSDESPEQDDATPETVEPVKLKALLEKAGIDLKDYYAATKDGQTLSELHDGAKDLGSLKTDREAFEAERVEFRTGKAQAEEQLEALHAAIISGKDPAKANEELHTIRKQHLEREQAKLLRVVPEWRDPSAKQADVEAMIEYASTFGVTAEDLGQIQDHRYIQMLRFNALQAKRLESLLANAEKPKPKGVKRSNKAPSASGQAVDIGELIKSASQ